MPNHASRVINVRCNYTDTSGKEAIIYKAGKYTYPYTSDSQRLDRINQAIAEYRNDNGLRPDAEIEYSYSVQSNR